MAAFDEAAYQRGLLQLRERFLNELPQRLAALRQTQTADAMRAELHRLAGAAGSLGFAELSQTARELEQQSLDHADGAISLARLDACASKIRALPNQPV
ncbi:Hpt domain-containing protein [Chitinilyticum piscinae]|uniref:Hpt domain-containing protein n=1 Tax=Chitinilyticum piscinae TaxID=2866724 RepID=A0A8J7FRI2_9NEIS|nr:Hpt domain-containing protein [Chitinilyticum piscinae]MBE9609546.1 Hpt domain-containing protein [Chitinilyticum piscinae]